VILQPHTFYVRGGRKDQGRIEPHIKAEDLPADGIISEFVDTEKSLSVWTAYFSSIGSAKLKKQDKRDDSSARSPLSSGWVETETETPSLENLSRVEQEFKTPRKLWMTPLLSVDFETLAIGRPRPEKLSEVLPLPFKDKGNGGQHVRNTWTSWRLVFRPRSQNGIGLGRTMSSSGKYRPRGEKVSRGAGSYYRKTPGRSW
jgi:hypothetical protein